MASNLHKTLLVIGTLLNFKVVLAIDDPCTKYLALNDSTRLTTYINKIGNGCDRLLKEGWYRNIQGSNGEMATSCPEIGECGSIYPVWINGTLPGKKGEEATVKACQRSLSTCCGNSFDISVKNCQGFHVYHLTALTECPSRYCFAGSKCPPGQSLDGSGQCRSPQISFTPGTVRVKPYIPSHDYSSPNRHLAFQCETLMQSSYRSYMFDIFWYIDGREVVSKSNLTYATISTDGSLLRKDWASTGKGLGIIVKCGIRARETPGSVPTSTVKSNDFFAGIKVINSTAKVVGGSSVNIYMQSTVPVACFIFNGLSMPCALRLEMFDYSEQNNGHVQGESCNMTVLEKHKPAACGIEIDGWNWQKTYNISVSTQRDQSYRPNYLAAVKLRSLGLRDADEDLWEGYMLQTVELTVINPNIHTRTGQYCRSFTDPHINTFDASHYSYYSNVLTILETGEFLLYKRKDKPISIHTIHRNMYEYENCAVAVQAGSDLFIVYGCEHVGKWIIRRICDGNEKRFEVYEKTEGREYEIHLPTGTKVGIMIHTSNVNVDIYASQSDWENTAGLCGLFNGNYNDDFTDRNGNVVGKRDFIRSWSVPNAESLFVSQSRRQVLAKSYFFCTCHRNIMPGTSNDNLNSQTDCSYHEGLPVCPLGKWNKQDCRFRHRRSLDNSNEEDDDIDIDAPSEIVNFKPALTTPRWRNGWNESAARDFCQRKLHNSPSFGLCNTIPKVVSGSSIELCVADIKVSGGVKYADDSVEAHKASCQREIQLNMTLWAKPSSNVKSLAEQIVEKQCPSDCQKNGTPRGTCIGGQCHCFGRYGGEDCSVDLQAGPEIFFSSSDNKCDKSKRTCFKISVFGQNFHASSDIKCRITLLKSDDKLSSESTTFTAGQMKSFGEVECPLPHLMSKRSTMSGIHFSHYLLSISNNAKNFSNAVPVVIFDSSCTECKVVNQRFVCQQRTDVCIIDNKCHAMSSSTCQSQEDKNTKETSNLWIIGAALGGVAITVVVVLVICKLKSKTRRVEESPPGDFDVVAKQKYTASAPQSTYLPYKC